MEYSYFRDILKSCLHHLHKKADFKKYCMCYIHSQAIPPGHSCLQTYVPEGEPFFTWLLYSQGSPPGLPRLRMFLTYCLSPLLSVYIPKGAHCPTCLCILYRNPFAHILKGIPLVSPVCVYSQRNPSGVTCLCMFQGNPWGLTCLCIFPMYIPKRIFLFSPVCVQGIPIVAFSVCEYYRVKPLTLICLCTYIPQGISLFSPVHVYSRGNSSGITCL